MQSTVRAGRKYLPALTILYIKERTAFNILPLLLILILSEFRLDQSVGAALSLVDHTYLLIFRVQEYEK